MTKNNGDFYSRNLHDAKIWSELSVIRTVTVRRLLNFVRNLPKRLRCINTFLSNYKYESINLKNKTIIMLNLAEYRLILANSTYGLVG